MCILPDGAGGVNSGSTTSTGTPLAVRPEPPTDECVAGPAGLGVPPNPVRGAAAGLRARGLALCRPDPAGKRPTYAGWSARSLEPHDFGPGDQLGVLGGPLSSGGRPGHALVVLDLDAPDAVRLADEHLPPTGMVEGRPGKPASHRFFLVPTATIPAEAVSAAEQAAPAAREATGHPGPATRAFRHRVTGAEVLKLIGTGGQVVCPPSVHPSGERREWAGGEPGEPAVVEFPTLLAACRRLAEACGAEAPERVRHPAPAAPADVPRTRPGSFGDAMRRAEAVARIRTYLDRHGPAIEGRGGRANLFRLARELVWGLALDPGVAVELLARWYNRECAPPWSDRELRRAVEDAGKNEDGGFALPYGWLLGEEVVDGDPVEAADTADTPTAEEQAGEDAGDDRRAWNDTGAIAAAVLREHRLVRARTTVYAYTGRHYVPVGDEVVDKWIGETLDAAAGQQLRRATHAWRCRVAEVGPEKAGAQPHRPNITARSIGDVRKILFARIQRPELVDRDRVRFGCRISTGEPVRLLPVANGLLDVRTGRLSPSDPDVFATTLVDVVFDPAARPSGRFLAMVEGVANGRRERVAVAQEMFGACLDPHGVHKLFWMLPGGGDNGKSAVLNALGALLGGKNVSVVPLDRLGERFESYGLLHKLANLVGDQGRFDSKDESHLKTLTGGDVVRYEEKGGKILYAPCTAKMVFACNTLPTFADRSPALWNRMCLLVCDAVFKDRKTAEEMNEKIRADNLKIDAINREAERTAALAGESPELHPHLAEVRVADKTLADPATWRGDLPGILNWALEGLARLVAAGPTKTADGEEMKAKHQLESDHARRFLAERYREVGTDDVDGKCVPFVVFADLYRAYREWADENGIAPNRRLDDGAFGARVYATFRLARSKVKSVGGGKKRCVMNLQRINQKENATG